MTVRLAQLVWASDAGLSGSWDRGAMEAAILSTEAALGRALVPQPVLTQASYTTTEIAEEAGISAQRAGAISNRHGLKVPANGENRMSKSQYSSKQVEQFHWNPTGKAALLAAIAAEFVPSRGNGAEPTVQQEGRA